MGAVYKKDGKYLRCYEITTHTGVHRAVVWVEDLNRATVFQSIVPMWLRTCGYLDGAEELKATTTCLVTLGPTEEVKEQDIVNTNTNQVKGSTMKARIKQLHENAQLPEYKSGGAACFDLKAAMSESETVHVPGGGKALIGTGWAFEVPQDHVMLLFSRSGHGVERGIRLSNCVGVIDSDYRGEVKVALHSDYLPISVNNGDRIAQGMIIPVEQVSFDIVGQLSETARGDGGFGSTGK